MQSENMPTLHRTFYPMRRTRLHLKETESTNDVGGQWLKTAMAGEILTVWTHHQTQGRGQRGRAWDQNPGLDLALTVAVKWPAQAPPRDPVALSKAATAGIRNAISSLISDSPVVRTVGIKWPNDILVENEDGQWMKCAGILIENTWRGTEWEGTLIGVGVNVNSVHAGTHRRCALGELTSSELTVAQVESRLSAHILDALDVHGSSLGYETHLVGCDQPNRFTYEGKSGVGTIKGVSAHGALEMEWTPLGDITQFLNVDRSDALQWDWLWE